MSRYTINKGQQGEKVLMIDGIQSFCPFVDPIPVQSQMGQMQIMRLPCNTACPHAKYSDNSYKISCGAEIKSFEITEEEDPKSDVISIVK